MAVSKVGTGCSSPVLKPCLPGKPSQGLRPEPFLARLAKGKIPLACQAPGAPGAPPSTEDEVTALRASPTFSSHPRAMAPRLPGRGGHGPRRTRPTARPRGLSFSF